MTAFLVVLHVLMCLFLILFVLLQPGARGGVGAAFGGAGGATVFGGRGANTFLAKLTAAAATVFMLTSITLSYFASRSDSVMDKRAKAAATATEGDDAAAVPADGEAVPAEGAAAPAEAAPAEAAPAEAAPAEAAPAEAAPAEGAPVEGAAAPAPAGDAPPAP
jgi:preprotein translocase subunit SecG